MALSTEKRKRAVGGGSRNGVPCRWCAEDVRGPLAFPPGSDGKETGWVSSVKILFSFLFHLSQGTVIRVFSIPEGQKLFEFRRGVKR